MKEQSSVNVPIFSNVKFMVKNLMHGHIRFLQTVNIWLSLGFPKLVNKVICHIVAILLPLADISSVLVRGCILPVLCNFCKQGLL